VTDEQLQKYLRKCAARGLGDKTIRNYHINLLTFEKWRGDKLLIELVEDDIDDYIFYLKKITTINDTTLNNKLRDLRAFLKFAHSRGWCDEIEIRLLKVQEPDIIPLEDDQLREIYDACNMKKKLDRVRDYTIMRLLEETGIRLSECMGLEFNDVNIKVGSVKLKKTKNKKAREAYLTPAMKKDLNLYLEARKHFLAANGLENKTDIWIAVKAPSKGKAVSARTIQEQLHKYGEMAGIPVRVSPHTFRHTFARNFLINGGDIFTLQELLGHSSLEMVRRYVRLFDKDKQNSYLKVMEKRQKDRKRNGKKPFP
jgi:integrase/recombinase XerD